MTPAQLVAKLTQNTLFHFPLNYICKYTYLMTFSFSSNQAVFSWLRVSLIITKITIT